MEEVLSRREQLERMYGDDFPDLDNLPEDPHEQGKLWRAWIDKQIEQQREALEDKRLHWNRHRLFRWGHQWISTRDGRKWREMEASNNRIRRTFNIVGPSLDFRQGIVEEQRPGWKYEPVPGLGVDGKETAEAQQSVVEDIFKKQKMWRLFSHSYNAAQTDGVCWLQVYIDKDSGPIVERTATIPESDERFKALKAQGYEVVDGSVVLPLGPTGDELGAQEKPSTFKAGEIKTRRILAAETYADVEAETINGPNNPAKWFLIRRPRTMHAARLETGMADLKPDPSAYKFDLFDGGVDVRARWSSNIPPYPAKRTSASDDQTWEITLYFAPSKAIGRKGLWVKLMGEYVLDSGKLPGAIIPIVKVTDGSTDPELFPRPEVSEWISDQMSINAMGSKILEYVRMHSGSKLMAMKDTLIEETWSNIVGSVLEYRGSKPDVLPPPRVSPDLWQIFMQMVQRLEDKTGYNDLARGKVSNVASGFQDVSGRAVLGAREMFERQFGPMIRGVADSATDWADIVIKYAQHLYKTPRLIPMAGRPDLAKKIDSELLHGQPSVYVDPETLMPMPRALRNQMLIDHVKEGIISLREYRKRSPYAEIRDLTFGDTEQWNRAQWINTVLEENWPEYIDIDPLKLFSPSQGIQIFWQDDPEIHMAALDELILDDKKPWQLRKVAADRWGIYAELARSKSFPMELELQGAQRPPAPAEVFGVPNMVPQHEMPQEQTTVDANVPPGTTGQPATSASPMSSPVGVPTASRQSAAPVSPLEM